MATAVGCWVKGYGWMGSCWSRRPSGEETSCVLNVCVSLCLVL